MGVSSTTTMQPHPLQLPHYMLTFQGHAAFHPNLPVQQRSSSCSLVALKSARSQLQQEMTYGRCGFEQNSTFDPTGKCQRVHIRGFSSRFKYLWTTNWKSTVVVIVKSRWLLETGKLFKVYIVKHEWLL